MPQPLSSVESNGHVILGAKLVCREFPDLVVRVAHTIALATLIETLAIELLTSMSGSHGKPAAMVGSWPSLKKSVNKAVSNAIAEQDDQDLFNAVLAECDDACIHRHRFAHWVWAKLAMDPGERRIRSLLFVDPKALLGHSAEPLGFTPDEGRAVHEGIDKGSIFVYRESDLNGAVKQTERALHHLAAIRILATDGGRPKSKPVTASLRRRLSTAPEIFQRLDRLRAQRTGEPSE